jgi:hypothetical protein
MLIGDYLASTAGIVSEEMVRLTCRGFGIPDSGSREGTVFPPTNQLSTAQWKI